MQKKRKFIITWFTRSGCPKGCNWGHEWSAARGGEQWALEDRTGGYRKRRGNVSAGANVAVGGTPREGSGCLQVARVLSVIGNPDGIWGVGGAFQAEGKG